METWRVKKPCEGEKWDFDSKSEAVAFAVKKLTTGLESEHEINIRELPPSKESSRMLAPKTKVELRFPCTEGIYTEYDVYRIQ